MGKLIDLTGKRFGRLEVLERTGALTGHARWLCQCDCGAQTVVFSGHLRSGHTSSCGCYKTDCTTKRMTIHGLSDLAEFGVWAGMLQRCSDSNHKSYPNYGGRGISVAPEWLLSFETFYKDVGPRPGAGFSLDRVDNNGNYEPGNVRWATAKEQANNRRQRRAANG